MIELRRNKDEVPSLARPRRRASFTALKKSAGGIIIPDTVKEKPMEGEVIAAGPGARNDAGAVIALAVKAGDHVLFGKWSGTEVMLDGEELLIMKEGDLMGIIDPVTAQAKAA